MFFRTTEAGKAPGKISAEWRIGQQDAALKERQVMEGLCMHAYA